MSDDYDDYDVDWIDEFDPDEEDFSMDETIELQTMQEVTTRFLAFCQGDGKKPVSFAILTREPGENFKLHLRWNQPCYGELCLYGEASRNLPDVVKPDDLHSPFPDGTPERIYIPAPRTSDSFLELRQELLEFIILDPKSPWRSLKPSAHRLTNGEIVGYSFDADIEPTCGVQLAMFIRNTYDCLTRYKILKKELPSATPGQLLFLTATMAISPYSFRDAVTGSPAPGIIAGTNGHILRMPEYYLSSHFDPQRWFNSDLIPLTNGSFRERYSYDRKRLGEVFGHAVDHFKDLREYLTELVIEKRDKKTLPVVNTKASYWSVSLPASVMKDIHEALIERLPGYAAA